jgi:hypothetical protein
MSGITVDGDVNGQVAIGETVTQTQTGTNEATRAPIVILFWASNPVGTSPLRLDEEVRTIDERLRASEFRDRFELEQQWALRISDLSEGLLRHRPVIVHFSGHGNPTGEIVLERPDGTAAEVAVSALVGLFGAVAGNDTVPRAVVLNACFSEAMATAIADHVDCVVGTTKAIGDSAAIAFAAGFYRALGYGESVQSAFLIGRNEIELHGLGEEATPKLISHIDPSQLRLVSDDGASPPKSQ